MDKETLSQYGWIVICIIIIALMLGLATPFGKYIGDATLKAMDSFRSKTETTLDIKETNKGEVNGTTIIEVKNGDEVPAFPNDGVTYSEWNTEADGTGISYNPGDKVVVQGAHDILYAIQKASGENLYPLHYNSVYKLVDNGFKKALENATYTLCYAIPSHDTMQVDETTLITLVGVACIQSGEKYMGQCTLIDNNFLKDDYSLADVQKLITENCSDETRGEAPMPVLGGTIFGAGVEDAMLINSMDEYKTEWDKWPVFVLDESISADNVRADFPPMNRE